MWFLTSILALNRDDEELTGSEDPSVLHSVVANLPAQQAYKEGKTFVGWGGGEGWGLRWDYNCESEKINRLSLSPCTSHQLQVILPPLAPVGQYCCEFWLALPLSVRVVIGQMWSLVVTCLILQLSFHLRLGCWLVPWPWWIFLWLFWWNSFGGVICLFYSWLTQ